MLIRIPETDYTAFEIDIKRVTLLSYEEAEMLPKEMRKSDSWWWLQTPGLSENEVFCVSKVGLIARANIDNNKGFVRPAIKFDTDNSNLVIGDVFCFASIKFEVISEDTAFCLTNIGQNIFDQFTNHFRDSEIQNVLHNWYYDALAAPNIDFI